MKSAMILVAVAAIAATCCAADAPKLVFKGVERGIVVLVEVRTPVPKKLGQFTSAIKKFNLSPWLSGTNFYGSPENAVKSQAFLEGLFARGRPFKFGEPTIAPPSPAVIEPAARGNKWERRGAVFGGPSITIIFSRDGKDVSIDELFSDWLTEQGIK